MKQSTRVQRIPWGKAPMVGNPIPPVRPVPKSVVSVGVASGIDPRYQVDPAKFAGGEFSRLRPGEYAADATSCAAKATRR